MPHPKLDIRVVDSVAGIGPGVWNALSAGRPFQGYRWYRYGEAVLSDCAPTHILVSRDGEPVARATFWLKRQEWWLPFSSRLVRYGLEKFIQHNPFFVCEAPLVCAPGLALADDPPLQKAALGMIADNALELCGKNRASFVIFGYIQDEHVKQGGWPGSFSAFSFSGAETSLEVAWPDFDGYLKHLAKSTRRNYKLHCLQADEMGVVVSALSEVTDMDQALALIRNVDQHHQMVSRPWIRGMLENLDLVDSTWISARVGDRLAGCCLLAGDDGCLTATLLGLDYSIPQSIYIYYQIMYAAIRISIERKARFLYGGGGAYEFKRRLGFRLLPEDYLVVAGANRLFRGIVRSLAPWAGGREAGGAPADGPGTGRHGTGT